MPLAYQTPHKPSRSLPDSEVNMQTPHTRGHPTGAANELTRGASAGHDAQGDRARKLFAKLDVERREQFSLRHLALGHDEAVFTGIEAILDEGQEEVDRDVVVLRPDFLRATSELGMGGESLWRFENMVNATYGVEESEEAAAELRAAEATAEGGGGEVRSPVVRKWSFLEDTDDEETVDTGPNPKDIEAVQTLIRTILRVQSKFEEYTSADNHIDADGRSKNIRFPIDARMSNNRFGAQSESTDIVPYEREKDEWGEEYDADDEPPGGVWGFFRCFVCRSDV